MTSQGLKTRFTKSGGTTETMPTLVLSKTGQRWYRVDSVKGRADRDTDRIEDKVDNDLERQGR